jgi:aminopeptidase N
MRALAACLCLPFALLACQSSVAPRISATTPLLLELGLRQFDLEHYSLDITLEPSRRSLAARVKLRLVARQPELAAIQLALVDLKVLAVKGEACVPGGFAQDEQGVRIPLRRALSVGEAVDLEVEYAGQPTRGLYFARERGGQPTQAWTQGECVEVSGWMPNLLDPADRASGEIRVRMPKNWRAMAAGVQLSREEQGEQAVEHWRMDLPHPAYLVTLAAGEFVEAKDELNGLPLHYLVAPEYEACIPSSFDRTPEILQFFSRITARRYPWPKYAQTSVDNFHFGGMENISSTTLTDLALVDELAARDQTMDGLVAHEAAHQWFGDLVTCEDWSQAWLNEGFATYFTALYTAESEGEQAFQLAMDEMNRSMAERAIKHPPRAIVWDQARDPMQLFLTGHIYAGAAQRLHLLRASIGDEAFFRGVRLYLSRHQHGSVRTADLLAAMESASGRQLDAFFAQWFETPGAPSVELRWKHDAAAKVLLVSIDQTHAVAAGVPACFRIDTELEIADAAGVRRVPVTLDSRKELLELPSEQAVRWVRFDPRGYVPKQLTEEWSLEALLVLAKDAREAPARRTALERLIQQHRSQASVQELLVGQLTREPLARLRALIAGAIEPSVAGAQAALVQAARTEEAANVRSAALDRLAGWPPAPELRELAMDELQQPYSYATLGAAANLLVIQDAEFARERLRTYQTQGDAAGRTQKALLRAWLQLGERARLIEWARDAGRPVLLREACVRALPKERELLRSLLSDASFRVRRAAIEGLDARDADLLRPRLASPMMPEVIAVEAALARMPERG